MRHPPPLSPCVNRQAKIRTSLNLTFSTRRSIRQTMWRSRPNKPPKGDAPPGSCRRAGAGSSLYTACPAGANRSGGGPRPIAGLLPLRIARISEAPRIQERPKAAAQSPAPMPRPDARDRSPAACDRSRPISPSNGRSTPCMGSVGMGSRLVHHRKNVFIAA